MQTLPYYHGTIFFLEGNLHGLIVLEIQCEILLNVEISEDQKRSISMVNIT